MAGENDQVAASIRDQFPPVWWGLYTGCMERGFTEKQAFALVTTFILSNNPNGIRPDNPFGQGPDVPPVE